MKTTFFKLTGTSLLLILVLLIQVNPVSAQQKNTSRQHSNEPGSRHEKMEAQRIAFITQQLNLTPEEAQAFWPVYNEYDAKRHEMRKSFRESSDLKKDQLDKLTEAEASQILDNQIIEAQRFLDLRKEYHAKFKSVLPAIKVLKLYESERDFQKMLIDKLRQSGQKTPMDRK